MEIKPDIEALASHYVLKDNVGRASAVCRLLYTLKRLLDLF